MRGRVQDLLRDMKFLHFGTTVSMDSCSSNLQIEAPSINQVSSEDVVHVLDIPSSVVWRPKLLKVAQHIRKLSMNVCSGVVGRDNTRGGRGGSLSEETPPSPKVGEKNTCAVHLQTLCRAEKCEPECFRCSSCA